MTELLAPETLESLRTLGEVIIIVIVGYLALRLFVSLLNSVINVLNITTQSNEKLGNSLEYLDRKVLAILGQVTEVTATIDRIDTNSRKVLVRLDGLTEAIYLIVPEDKKDEWEALVKRQRTHEDNIFG